MEISQRMLERIKARISEITETLRENGYEPVEISEYEFYLYLTGETPYQEKYRLDDILESEFLMIHEVVEIGEFKRKGLPINRRTVMDSHPVVYEAHLIATEVELSYALKTGNYSWIRTRLRDMRSWKDDEFLPSDLLPKINELLRKYGSSLRNPS